MPNKPVAHLPEKHHDYKLFIHILLCIVFFILFCFGVYMVIQADTGLWGSFLSGNLAGGLVSGVAGINLTVLLGLLFRR